MSYQFPFPATPVLQEALNIATGYLQSTLQDGPSSEAERLCVNAIYHEWLAGKRHRIWLANKAIIAVEQERALRKRADNQPLELVEDSALP